MKHQFTKAEVELAIARINALLSSGLLDKTYMIDIMRKEFNPREDSEKILNLLWNLKMWMENGQ